MKRSYMRYIARGKEEIYSTYQIAKITSMKDAFLTLKGKMGIQVMVRNGHVETSKIKSNLLIKHEIMNKYFDKVFADFIDRYNGPSVDDNTADYSDCIWMCWWQGEDNAPNIVKKCINSVRRNASGHRVIVLTDENYTNYVKFPDWIIDKYKNGIITKTHLSDLLRIFLLADYGGIWLDATFYCTDSIEEYFNMPVWTIKRPDYRHVSVSCGQFANYSFGCNRENRVVFAIIRDYLLEYWKKYDYMVDYLFLDYLIMLSIRNEKVVFDRFNEVVPNNPECDDLLTVLGNEFDESILSSWKKHTRLFKLTWKAEFPNEINHKKTFFGELFSDDE